MSSIAPISCDPAHAGVAGAGPASGGTRSAGRSIDRALRGAARSLRLLACFCALTAPAAAGAPPAPAASAEGVGIHLPLRLELIPFEDPRSILIAIEPSGRLRCFRFFPSRAVVSLGAELGLAADERAKLARLLASSQLAQALRNRNMAGDGLTHGDLFQLALHDSGGRRREVHGVFDKAPPDLQGFIRAILQTAAKPQRLAAVPLAHAYVRARPVEPERAQDLRRTTAIRVAELADLTPAARSLARLAAGDPLLFHPVTPALRAELDVLRSLGEQVFVRIGDGRLYELRLYGAERPGGAGGGAGPKGLRGDRRVSPAAPRLAAVHGKP